MKHANLGLCGEDREATVVTGSAPIRDDKGGGAISLLGAQVLG